MIRYVIFVTKYSNNIVTGLPHCIFADGKYFAGPMKAGLKCRNEAISGFYLKEGLNVRYWITHPQNRATLRGFLS
jgi:hypothetical protein